MRWLSISRMLSFVARPNGSDGVTGKSPVSSAASSTTGVAAALVAWASLSEAANPVSSPDVVPQPAIKVHTHAIAIARIRHARDAVIAVPLGWRVGKGTDLTQLV